MNENNNANQLYDLISNIKAKLNSESENAENNSTYEPSIDMNNKNTSDQNIPNNNNNTNNNNNFDFSNMDINTILKIQSMFSKFNRSSPKKQLLYSLKPFLSKDRQNSLSEYITILSIMDALDLFNKKGSD